MLRHIPPVNVKWEYFTAKKLLAWCGKPDVSRKFPLANIQRNIQYKCIEQPLLRNLLQLFFMLWHFALKLVQLEIFGKN